MTRDERKLLARIGAIPAGERLPIARFARELNASQALVISLAEGLVRDGHLDKVTLRPIERTAVHASEPARGKDDCGDLFERLVAEGARRGLSILATSVAVFGHRAQIYGLRDRTPRQATVAKVEAWIADDDVPQPPASTPAGADEAAAGDAKPVAASSPDRPTGAQLLAEIDAFIATVPGLTRSRFGVALGSRAVCYHLEGCRRPKSQTVAKVRAFIADPPDLRAFTARVEKPGMRRAERAAIGLAPSLKELNDRRSLERLEAQRDREQDALAEAEVARATRRPGETLAQAVKREASERETRFREATRLTTLNPLPAFTAPQDEDDPDIGAVTADRRQREAEELATPSSVLRLAQREWPDQCAKVKALAAELGVTLAEAWRRTISAGVECLTDPEAA